MWVLFLGCGFFFRGLVQKRLKQHKNNQGSHICGPEVGVVSGTGVEGT
jgi:hypothetical protein